MMQEIAWNIVSNDPYTCLPTLGTEETNLSTFEIYPNPSDGIVNFTFSTDNTRLSIVDLSGKEFARLDVSNVGIASQILPAGSYIAVLYGDKGAQHKRIVVY